MKLPLIYLFLLTILTPKLSFSHAGEHHPQQECFIELGDYHLKLNGYQLHQQVVDKQFCYVFPNLGLVSLTLESANSTMSNKKISLTIRANDELWHIIFNSNLAFKRSVKHIPLQPYENGLLSTQLTIEEKGLYALDIKLLDANGTYYQQRHYFLVGYPLLKFAISLIIFIFSLAFLQLWWKKRNK